MPTPEFILTLREKVGHDLLFLPGLAMVVLDDSGRLLLTRRRDAPDHWALIGGILEPGEQPLTAAIREVREETGVEIEVERLAGIEADREPGAYPNGDQVQFLTLVFRCRYLSGEAHVADDENEEVGWFAPDNVPALSEAGQRRLAWAYEQGPAPVLER